MVPKKALHAGEHGYVRKNVNSATCCHASGNCLHAIAAQPHLAKTAHHISVLKPWKQSAVQCSQTSHSDSSTNKIQSVFLYDQHDSSDGNVIDPPVQEKNPVSSPSTTVTFAEAAMRLYRTQPAFSHDKQQFVTK
ncbi:hypothetical protein ANPL_03610 [Anaplasma platys]|uniref:Uncharacterized protein n=1 Tax=Anaplasma platys TaxID=949 RepID=A0A858PYT4_9RICK|nr:hypothetical protein ANPL_03610 [Anaplasma platys]